jgi:hypothetical protein
MPRWLRSAAAAALVGACVALPAQSQGTCESPGGCAPPVSSPNGQSLNESAKGQPVPKAETRGSVAPTPPLDGTVGPNASEKQPATQDTGFWTRVSSVGRLITSEFLDNVLLTFLVLGFVAATGAAAFVWWLLRPGPIPPSEPEPIASFEDAALHAQVIKREIENVLRKAGEIRDDLARAAIGSQNLALRSPRDERPKTEESNSSREYGTNNQSTPAKLAQLDGTLSAIGLQLTHLIERMRQIEGNTFEKHERVAKNQDDKIQYLRNELTDRENRIKGLIAERNHFEQLANKANEAAEGLRRDKEMLRHLHGDLTDRIEAIESDLRTKESALRTVTTERDLLRDEHDSILEEARQAKQRHAEAEVLLAQYQEGMPKFLHRAENGTHYQRFFDLITEANSAAPGQVERLAIMLRVFAGANAREDSAFELVWCVHEIGKALYAVMQALGNGHEWQYEEAIAWALALNKEGNGRYRIFVPVVSASVNTIEMTGGSPNGAVQVVKSWGVKNARGDVERKAIVQ